MEKTKNCKVNSTETKKQWKGFLAGIISAMLIFSLGGQALANTVRQINASYSGIKITLDGNTITPKDANGTIVEPFAVDGTTYLPVRAVAEAVGLNVAWDGATQTVILTTQGNTATQPSRPSTGEEVSYEITYQDCRLVESYGRTRCYAIVEIENTGTADLYLDDATFDFEDQSGHLLETESWISSDPNIIGPGEKGYFYLNMGTTLDIVDTSTDYVFKPTLKVEKSKNPIIRYEITDTAMTSTSQTSVTITGRVQNNTNEDNSLAWVFIVLYREDGTPITAGGTNIMDGLKAGETASFSRQFSGSELGVNASEVASYQIYACKTQYQF